MSTIASLIVKLGLDKKDFDEGLKGVGSTLTRTLTPAAAAVSAAAFLIHKDWDEAVDSIRVGTGATGHALQDLLGDAKKVGKGVSEGFAVIGPALADLNTRLGLTGKPLQDMTTQFLELSRITKTDVKGNIADLTRVFGDWNVAADKQPKALDAVFKASQSTGIGINQLAQSVVQFGAPMRGLGFSFEQSVALMSKWEKEGVNSEAVLSGLKIGLGKMLATGKDAPKVLADLQQSFEKNGESAANVAKVYELFGQRAGVDIVKAMSEGRFAIGDLVNQIASGKDTVSQAAKDTLDFSDKLKMMKNSITATLGPGAELIGWLSGGVAAVGPFLMGVGQLAPFLGTAAGAVATFGKSLLALAANPVVLIIAAIAAIVLVVVWLIKHWDEVKAVALEVFNTIKDAIGAAWEWIKEKTEGIWNGIKEKTEGIWNGIKSFIRGAVDFLVGLFLNFTPVGLIIKHWDTIKQRTSEAWEWVKGKISGIWEGIKGGIQDAVEWVVEKFKALKDKLTAPIDAIKGLIKKLPFVPGSPIPMVVWANQAVREINAAWKGLQAPRLPDTLSMANTLSMDNQAVKSATLNVGFTPTLAPDPSARMAMPGISAHMSQASVSSSKGETVNNFNINVRTDADAHEISKELGWAMKVSG